MNKKIFSITTLFIASILPISTIVSCSANKNNELVFVLSKEINNQTNTMFVEEIKKNFNILKKDSHYKDSNFSFTTKTINDKKAKKDLLENGSATFTFLPFDDLIQNNFYKQSQPLIQTLTTSFKFDNDMKLKYVDGSKNDPLRIIANNMLNLSFGISENRESNIFPFETWMNEKGKAPLYDWNGIRYNHFYSESTSNIMDNLTNGYRGMIVVSGTKTQRDNAKTAWDNKNWEDFRNLGIIYGNQTSNGNYKLQEKLLREHFNLGDSWTLALDMKNNSLKYLFDEYGTEKIGKLNEYVISFTDEGSFAWTNNKKNKDSFRPRDNASIEFLTVTNPAPYDIGVFSGFIKNDLAYLIAKSIEKTFIDNNNNYGESLGYNGYKIINDFDKEVIGMFS